MGRTCRGFKRVAEAEGSYTGVQQLPQHFEVYGCHKVHASPGILM